MSERKPIKERLKQFEKARTEATALSLTSSPPSLGTSTSGQAEAKSREQSLARQRRHDERNKSSPTHTSSTKDKSAGHTGPQYPSTNNQALRESFGISEVPTGPASLTSPVTSPTRITSPSQNPYSSLQLDERHSNRIRAAGGNTGTDESMGGGGRTPVPPLSSQRPTEPFVRARSYKRPGQGDEGNSRGNPPEPMKAKHDKQMLRADSGDPSQPTLESHRPHNPQYLSTQYSTDSLPSSPPCSDEFPPQALASNSTDGSPCQVADSLAKTKFVGGAGHASLNCDPVTGKTTNRVNLFKQLSTASSGSSGSDKLCLTDSIPMGIFTGEKKIETSCNRNYREENDKLRVEIERLKNEVKVLYDAVETSIDKQGNGRDIASGDFPSGLEGMDDCDMGVAKMVTNRSSMRTDDKGNPIPSSAVGRRESRQEQELMRQVASLKYRLTVQERDVTTLTEQNARKKETIDTLTKTVGVKDHEKRRGYHSNDVDEYFVQVTQLTSQLSALEDTNSEHVNKIAKLQGQLSRMTEVARLTKRLRDDNTRLETEVKELTSSLESAQQSIDDISTPVVEEQADTRLLTLEAVKVPDVQNEVEVLKQKLADVEDETTRHFQDRLMGHVLEISQKEEDLRKLSSEMVSLREQNASLSSRLLSPTTSDPTLGTDSYQILLQDSTDKNQKMQQLKSLVEEKQMLLEVKAQELQEKRINMETENAQKMEEINKLKDLNVKLRERVVTLTTPIGSQSEASAGTTETEVLQQGGAQLGKDNTDTQKKLNKAGSIVVRQKARIKELEQQIRDLEPGQKIKATDSDRKLTRASSKIESLEETIKELQEQIERGQPMPSGNGGGGTESAEVIDEQQRKIRNFEQQIHDLEVGNESLNQAMDKNQATVDKMSRDQVALLEHSKSQSKTILELRVELKSLRESKNELEATLRRQQNERKTLDHQYRKVISDKIKVEEQLTKLQEHLRDSNSADELTRMEADVTRLRSERNELKKVVTELSHKSAHLKEVEALYEKCQQKSIAQSAVIDNQQKELNDLKREAPSLRGALTKQHTELQQVARQRDELMGDLEAYKQTAQAYEADFVEERKDRETAHSKIADMENRYGHQLEAMAKELETKSRELNVALHANSALKETKAQLEGEVTSLNYTMRDREGRYEQEVMKLQEDIQAKTAQVKQYKKQVDQFRDQVEAGKDQAEILKAQVESTVTQTHHLEKESNKIKYENQQLIGRLRHMEATQSQHPNDRRLQEELDKCLRTIDALNMKNAMLLSELEELKKRGVASSQAPPTRASESNAARQMIGNRSLLPNQGAMRPPAHPPQQLLVPRPQQAPHPQQMLHPQRLDPQWKTQSVDDSSFHSRGQRLGHDGRPAYTGYVDQGNGNMADPHRHPRTADLGRLSHAPQQQSPAYSQQGRNLPPPSSNADPQLVGIGGTTRGSYGHPTYSNVPLSSGFGQPGPASLPPSIGSPTHGQGYGRPDVGGAYQQADLIERDSPPSSYQSPSTTSASQQSNARNQFANKHPGMSQSSDSFYNQSTGGQHRPHTGKPIPAPRIQGGNETNGRRPMHYGTGQQQLHQVPSSGLPPTTNAQHRAHSSQVPHPQQESRGAAAVRAPLPHQMRVQSQNVSHRPPALQQSAGRRHTPHTNSREEESASSDSNQLDKNIDKEIRQEAMRVARQGSGEDSQSVEGDTIPPDPNLICPRCGRQFRLGEIQKFKRHADNCGH